MILPDSSGLTSSIKIVRSNTGFIVIILINNVSDTFMRHGEFSLALLLRLNINKACNLGWKLSISHDGGA
ncbi:MAG TPA: hypothetical protein VEI57_03700 [Nitrospirota bacterium]|nr:hypothetical protein [Nitrospirota bacterium]